MTKHFLATGETAARLNVSRSQLQNLFPLLPHLYVHKPGTRLFPAAYIEGYAEYLRSAGKRAGVATARAFWSTPEARAVVSAAQERITASINSKTLYSPGELTDLLSVARMTVTHWYQNDVLKIVHQKAARKRDPGTPSRILVFIPATELKKAIGWKLPSS